MMGVGRGHSRAGCLSPEGQDGGLALTFDPECAEGSCMGRGQWLWDLSYIRDKRVTNGQGGRPMERKKTRMNCVVLEKNWRYGVNLWGWWCVYPS